MKDIKLVENVQHRATKFIVNDFSMDYKGQFCHNDVKIDESERTLVLPDKSPVPGRYRPVWGFITGHGEYFWTVYAGRRADQGDLP